MIVYGPVPSRRLGRSLGVNNIPPKVCSYSCVYCQVGRTKRMAVQPRRFYDPQTIYDQVIAKKEQATRVGETLDYLTFVPDGEPTLDVRLGETIERIRACGVKIAVITNSSLIWRKNVQADLQKADWVSLKIDAVQTDIWRKINRPHRALQLPKILEGIIEFAEQYDGQLVTETMLVRDLNDSREHLHQLADFIMQLPIERAYLSVPIRPPAEKWVQPPTEEALIRAYRIMDLELKSVEYLIGYEGNAFAFTGNVEKDLLSITAVHPMREEAVSEFLNKAQADWSVIDRLIDRGMLVEKEFREKKFYARKLMTPTGKTMP